MVKKGGEQQKYNINDKEIVLFIPHMQYIYNSMESEGTYYRLYSVK